MKILIVKRDKIGDLLLTTPMLRELRRSLPKAEIHLLANDYNAWVVESNPDINKLWIYRRARVGKRFRITAVINQIRQTIRLRSERFDVVIAANGTESPRAINRALGLQGRRCIAYCSDPALIISLTDPLTPPVRQHEIERLLALLRPLNIEPGNSEFPTYDLPSAADKWAHEWLAERGISLCSYTVLGMSARMPDRQPAAAQVLRWSSYLKSAHNLDTVFMWSPDPTADRVYPGNDAAAKSVVDAGKPYIHPLRGGVPFRESFTRSLGLIWNARFSIFPDSGLMHFAAASPGGVLGLFSDKSLSVHADQWRPRGPNAISLEAPAGVPALDDKVVYEALLPFVRSSKPNHPVNE